MTVNGGSLLAYMGAGESSGEAEERECEETPAIHADLAPTTTTITRATAAATNTAAAENRTPTPHTATPTQTLTVSYDVEYTVEREHGYAEHYLTYNGERVPYKGITKDGRFVAIVSRRYVLIPSEVVEAALREAGHTPTIIIREGWRTYWVIPAPKLDDRDPECGVLVGNSVDGSQALRVYTYIKLGDAYAVLKESVHKVNELEARHLEGIKRTVGELPTIVRKILGNASQNGYYLAQMDYRAEAGEVEGILKLDLPDYVKSAAANAYRTMGTLRAVYEEAAKAIWRGSPNPHQKKPTILTKLEHYTTLNNYIFTLTWYRATHT
ncbi:hypothetical protein B9Q03_10560 [Candidatus Marsarchaeota G2 archaeon OSP_D]|jgi:hypothetical protein|uniref:Uncharacterized protein n=1 Tax=Candidatus Marsarchaeota G2 archaeon OSP_D TaxID=1978157 RepID=A0A2R6AM54_9ARCH|nr:MAG: hypothetical protein B9Q03_10560 [Candidatus Marsarchaeota G2 archaeon OSP_D]